jgi:ketosteroid isomerase-like protein
MTRTSLAVFMLLTLLVAPRPAVAQQASQEDEVRAAVSAFGRAFVEADVSVLQRLLTNDYVHVNGRSGSVLNRDEWLKWVAFRRADLNSGELVISAHTVEDVKVQVHGEAAVVTGVAYSSGQRKGASFTSRVRFTNVWIMQGGAWRRAAFHDSPLPESGASG